MPTTDSPRATSRRMSRGPMKPVAPITSTDMPNLLWREARCHFLYHALLPGGVLTAPPGAPRLLFIHAHDRGLRAGDHTTALRGGSHGKGASVWRLDARVQRGDRGEGRGRGHGEGRGARKDCAQ